MIMDDGNVFLHYIKSNKIKRMFTVSNLRKPLGFACFGSNPTVAVISHAQEYRFNKDTEELSISTLERLLIGAKLIFPLPGKGAAVVPTVRDSTIFFVGDSRQDLR
eukprot:Rmarinus@m.7627